MDKNQIKKIIQANYTVILLILLWIFLYFFAFFYIPLPADGRNPIKLIPIAAIWLPSGFWALIAPTFPGCKIFGILFVVSIFPYWIIIAFLHNLFIIYKKWIYYFILLWILLLSVLGFHQF